MKLYYSPGACSLSPHIVLREAGLAFELVLASTKTKKLQDGTDFYTINPKGSGPVLELDKGQRLFTPGMVEEAKPLFRAKLLERFKYVDQQLEGKSYLMGETFTVADAYLFTVSNWGQYVGVDIAPFANLAAFRARVSARPAVQAALEAEGLLKK
jgi:glutathione S-transferase